jgi:hypothetical protein
LQGELWTKSAACQQIELGIVRLEAAKQIADLRAETAEAERRREQARRKNNGSWPRAEEQRKRAEAEAEATRIAEEKRIAEAERQRLEDAEDNDDDVPAGPRSLMQQHASRRCSRPPMRTETARLPVPNSDQTRSGCGSTKTTTAK